MDKLDQLIADFASFVWGLPLIILLIGGGLYLLILSKFLQEKNNMITFYTFDYDKELFADENISFKVQEFYSSKIGKLMSFFIIAYKIRKSDYIIA
ncbi:MAG: hypothetical protein IIC74_07895 [Bacteroidetes bacterium]|nr:hypothetical protein [Bacteroidota bacterium]